MVDDAQLGAAARAPDGQRRGVGQLLLANLAVRDGNRGLGGPVGVCHDGLGETFPQLCRGGVVQRLSAEQEEPQVGKEALVKALVHEAEVGKGGRGDPHLDARAREVVKQGAEVGALPLVHRMQAAAGNKRPHELELAQVKGVVGLVEKDAAAFADLRELAQPLREAGDVCGRDLNALGAARRARGEDDVLGLLPAHPALARQRGRLKAAPLGVDQELARVEIARLQDHGCQLLGQLASSQTRRALDLAGDVVHPAGGQAHVDRHVGVAAHEAGEKRGHGRGGLASEDEHGAATGEVGVEPARDDAGLVPELRVGGVLTGGRAKGRGVRGEPRPPHD